MAKVTKINVGGTNYDIAHEGVLKNSGFEEVTELPTTGLFNGREVVYNGKKYVYSSGWKEQITSNTMYEANLLWGGHNIIGGYSPIDAAMISELSTNLMAFPNPAGITVEYSRDGGVTWLDYGAKDADKINLFTLSTNLTCGKANEDNLAANIAYMLRITINPYVCGLYSMINKAVIQISTNNSVSCWCTISALNQTNYNLGNLSDDYYKVFVNKAIIDGWPGYNVLNFIRFITSNTSSNSTKYRLVRFTIGYDDVLSSPSQGYYGLSIKSIRLFTNGGRYNFPSNLAFNNHLYSYDYQKNALFPAKVKSKEIVNFDVNNIEPTQTGNVTKTSTWLWQYLTQSVNWLNANKVALSVYNAKVSELVQADSDNNAYVQSVKEELTALIDEVSGGLANLAAVARSGSYNDLTDKPTLFSGSYNDLTDKPAIPNSFTDLSGTISSVQIPDGLIANAKLANSSMSLNGTTVNLGDTAVLPWYVDYNEVDYPARIRDHWLQIYRNGVWANLMYLGDILPTQVGQITSLDNLDWYNEQVSEYEVDSTTTTSILNGTTLPALVLLCTAEHLTLNLYPISGKEYGKGSLDSLISDLQGKGFSVFVENDLDAILASGNDYLVRIKISKVPTPKAIIECYVAR